MKQQPKDPTPIVLRLINSSDFGCSQQLWVAISKQETINFRANLSNQLHVINGHLVAYDETRITMHEKMVRCPQMCAAFGSSAKMAISLRSNNEARVRRVTFNQDYCGGRGWGEYLLWKGFFLGSIKRKINICCLNFKRKRTLLSNIHLRYAVSHSSYTVKHI